MSNEKKQMAIIVQSGTLDKLFPVFTLASTASAMDVEVHLFFTFWGFNALVRGGLAGAKLPAAMGMSTENMKERMQSMGIPTLQDLLQMCKETGNVKFYACSTTMELMNVKKEQLIPEVDQIVGAATFTEIALKSDISLFI